MKDTPLDKLKTLEPKEVSLSFNNSIPADILEGIIGCALAECKEAFDALQYGSIEDEVTPYSLNNTKATIAITFAQLKPIWINLETISPKALCPRHRDVQELLNYYCPHIEHYAKPAFEAQDVSDQNLSIALSYLLWAVTDIYSVLNVSLPAIIRSATMATYKNHYIEEAVGTMVPSSLVVDAPVAS